MSSSSGKRSINDVLMGNARAAAKKSSKGAPSSSSFQPKKVKTLEQCFGTKENSKNLEQPPNVNTLQIENSMENPKEMVNEKAENVETVEMALAEEKDSIVEAELKSSVKNKVKSQETATSSSPKKPKTLAACSKSNNAQEKNLKPCQKEKEVQDKDPEPDPSVEKKAGLELKKKGENFDPKKAAFWKPGEPVPFRFLAYALDLISNESGRIVITDILSNVFRTVMATTPGDLLATVYLAANRIAPPHEGIELGIGDAALIKALGEAYGRNDDQVKKQLKAS
jgi:DNA ligase 1